MKRETFIECGNEKLYFLFSVIEFDDIPMLFAVENDRRDLYLGLCSDTRGFFRWTLARTTAETIKSLIDKKITIKKKKKKDNGNVKIVEFRKEKGFSCELETIETISPYDLTKPGLFASYIEEDIDDQLIAYKQRCQQEAEQYRAREDGQASMRNSVSVSMGNHYVMNAAKMERVASFILDLYMASDGNEKDFSDYCLTTDQLERSVVVPMRYDASVEKTMIPHKDIAPTFIDAA